MAKSELTRRTFVCAGVAVAAGIITGCVGRTANAETTYVRPPLVSNDILFTAQCIKCERCTSICPQNVIKPVGIEGGFIQARSPQMNFKTNYCTFCNLCVEVCPTGALTYADPDNPTSGRIGCAYVHTDACLAFIDYGACGICIDTCEYKALSFDNQHRPVVDESKCNGCGKCEYICPANINTRFDGADYRGIQVISETALSHKEG